MSIGKHKMGERPRFPNRDPVSRVSMSIAAPQSHALRFPPRSSGFSRVGCFDLLGEEPRGENKDDIEDGKY